MKEAANQIWLRRTVAFEGSGSDAQQRAASMCVNKPTLEPSKRPALMCLCAGRITVDAREKG